MNCARLNQVLDAWLDGELDRETSADLSRHVGACPACAASRTERISLIQTLRSAAPYYRAPAALRSRVDSALAATGTVAASRRRPTWLQATGLAACAALLGALITYSTLRPVPDDPLREQLIASHVASLAEPKRLIVVASEERHVVKPWFQGKVDFAPVVRDLSDQGFVLLGGRVDHVGGRQAAALVYRIRSHVINLFVWPSNTESEPIADLRTRGFSVSTWTEEGLRYSAVSDVDPRDLHRFATLVRGQ